MSAGISPEITHLAEAVANRVRLIQVDCSEETPEKRHAFLCDEIERALADQTPARKRALIEQLMVRFPTWDAEMLRGEPLPDGEIPTPKGDDADWLVGRLEALASSMPAEQRQSVAERLRGAGLAPAASGGGWSPDAEQAVAQRLGFAGQEPMSPDRVMQLLGEQAQFLVQLEHLVRATWKELSPRSPIAPRGELKRLIERFACGDAEVSRTQLAEEMERVRRLTASMIAAIGRLSQVLGESLGRQLAPAVLEQAARQDKRWHEGLEVAAWKLYRERAQVIDEAELDREVRRLLVEYTESVARGMR